MKKLAFLIVAAVVPMLHAAPVLQLSWDIGFPTPNGKNAAPSNVYTTFAQDFIKSPNPSVTGGLIALGNTAAAANVNNAYRANFSQLSLAAAITNNDYLRLTVTPSGTLSFEQLVMNLQTATAGTFTWNLFSDKTGFAAGNVLQTIGNGSSNSIITWTVDLTAVSALQNVSTSTEFRIYGFRTAAGTSQAGFANQTGSTDIGVYAVPEPSSIALFLGATSLAVLGLRARGRGRLDS